MRGPERPRYGSIQFIGANVGRPQEDDGCYSHPGVGLCS
jgi:hypothetical protein